MTTDDASCWICLEEGVDDSGKPLRRDCSCRADNGFVHLSCLVEYAKTKCTSGEEGADTVWEVCPSCKQGYQKELALDLANAQLKFVEDEDVYPDPIQRDTLSVRALDNKVRAIIALAEAAGAGNSQQLRIEGKQLANKMLSLIGRVKKYGSEPWADMVEPFEVMALERLGNLCFNDGTDAGFRMSIIYYKKIRDHCKELGEDIIVHTAEERIAMAETHLRDGTLSVHGDDRINRELDRQKTVYAGILERMGKTDPQTLRAGTNLARLMNRDRQTIAAQRLLAELLSTSQLVHGKEHTSTKEIAKVLRIVKTRLVMYYGGDGKYVRFVALKYVNNGKGCVVTGPVPENTEHRDLSKEKTSTVDSRRLCYGLGTPVVCHGLTKATHLNGKIGDIRSGNTKTNRFCVYFDDAKVKPQRAEVKLENLRILFAVPGENNP